MNLWLLVILLASAGLTQTASPPASAAPAPAAPASAAPASAAPASTPASAVDSLGILAPGKVADLVILTRDPLGDIRHTLAIDRVMSRGSLFSADSLRKAW